MVVEASLQLLFLGPQFIKEVWELNLECFPHVGPSVIRGNGSPPNEVFLLSVKYLQFFSHYSATCTLCDISFPGI